MARKLWGVVLAAAVASAGAADEAAKAAPAQQRTDQPAARPRRTIIHFGEDDIRGDITRPDGELVQAPRQVAEGSLLRMRRSFIDRALAGAARSE
jgi:polyisoprenoid-binding protein YceI